MATLQSINKASGHGGAPARRPAVMLAIVDASSFCHGVVG